MDKILAELYKDSRVSADFLAKKYGMEKSEVEKKIADFEKNGIIHGYTVILDDRAFGEEQVSALIEVKITPRRDGGFDEVAQRIAKFPEVKDLFLVSGSYDLLINVSGSSLKEVANFVAAKLATIDGVLSTSTSFQLKKYKQAGHIFENGEDYERLKVCP